MKNKENMEFGVSIYCHLIKNENEIIKYVLLLKKYGIDFIFTTLVNLKNMQDYKYTKNIKVLAKTAHEQNIKVYADISDTVLEAIGLAGQPVDDLFSYFHDELLLSGIRYDEGELTTTEAAFHSGKFSSEQERTGKFPLR